MLKKEKNKLVLKFNSQIYPIKNVKKAVKDYSGLAKFSVKTNKGYVEITAGEIFNPEIFEDELSNYLLSLCINDKA